MSMVMRAHGNLLALMVSFNEAAAWRLRCASPVLKLPSNVLEVYNSRFQTLGTVRHVKGTPISEESVEELWQTLLTAYDGEEKAFIAISRNPTVMHPLYTDPPSVITNSKAALLEVLDSDEEVLTVMLQNPAVLQCGASLRTQPADQIKSFARSRQALDAIPKEVSQTALGLGLLTVGLTTTLRGSHDTNVQALLDIMRPLIGATGASLFLVVAFFASKSEADAARSRRQKDELEDEDHK